MSAPDEPDSPARPDRQPLRELLLAQALDACIDAERQLPGSSEDLIASQPAWARRELRRLVGLALSLDAATSNACMSSEFRAGARQRLMRRIGGDQADADLGPRQAWALATSISTTDDDAEPGRQAAVRPVWLEPPGPAPSRAVVAQPVRYVAARRRARWLWRGAAGLLAAALGLVATLTASASALPGEPLYSIKQAQEDLEVRLATDDQTRMLTLLRLADTRLAETARLLQLGRVGEVAATTQRYDDVIERATSSYAEVTAVNATLAQRPSATSNVQTELNREQDQLEALLQSAPEQTRDDLRQALSATQRGRALLADRQPIGRSPGGWQVAASLPVQAAALPTTVASLPEQAVASPVPSLALQTAASPTPAPSLATPGSSTDVAAPAMAPGATTLQADSAEERPTAVPTRVPATGASTSPAVVVAAGPLPAPVAAPQSPASKGADDQDALGSFSHADPGEQSWAVSTAVSTADSWRSTAVSRDGGRAGSAWDGGQGRAASRLAGADPTIQPVDQGDGLDGFSAATYRPNDSHSLQAARGAPGEPIARGSDGPTSPTWTPAPTAAAQDQAAPGLNLTDDRLRASVSLGSSPSSVLDGTPGSWPGAVARDGAGGGSSTPLALAIKAAPAAVPPTSRKSVGPPNGTPGDDASRPAGPQSPAARTGPDGPAPGGDRAGQPQSARSSSAQSSVSQAPGVQSSLIQPSAAQPSVGKQSSPQQASATQPSGAQQASATQPSGAQQASATQPSGAQQASATQPSGAQQQASATQPSGVKSAGAQPSGVQPWAAKASGTQAAGLGRR